MNTAMDSWGADYDDGLLNGMKEEHGLPAAPAYFDDNLETKPLLEDIDSYLNKNSALITSKVKVEESVGSSNASNSIIRPREGLSSPEKHLVKVQMATTVNNGVAVKPEFNHNRGFVFTPIMMAPGMIGFDPSVRPLLKPLKRGRPRIHPIKPDGMKRKPGRPRIHPLKPSDGIKRKPGRPRIHPLKPGEEGKPRRPSISPVIRHIRPKPDPSLMTFAGPIPHTFIPTAAMNSIQIPTPQPRPPAIRFFPPLPIIDPITGKRKRGRPRIHPVKIHDGIKRKPGRPRKVPLMPTSEPGKMVPVPVRKPESIAVAVETQRSTSVRSSELIEKVDVVENKDRRFSIEAEVPDNECKPFMCVACGDCFSTSDELMSHVVKHEEETSDDTQHNAEDSASRNHWPTTDAVKREFIDNGKDTPRESQPSLNYVERMRKLAKLSQAANNASHSINTQQQLEQQANTSRNEIATCS